MESTRFDQITSTFAQTRTRRSALGLLGMAALGASGLELLVADEGEARRRRKKKNKHKNQGSGTGTGSGGGTSGGGGNSTNGNAKGLHDICIPGQDTCSAGLQCGAPTTRHTCSSTVEGVDAWCCVPPGGRCSECDCCGDYYCAYDDNNVPMCVPNPEG
jgi:hypothetical protein